MTQLGELNKRIAVIGGCGHVGLPLGVKFAQAGAEVSLIDIDEHAVEQVNSGVFPFIEKGGEPELRRALECGLLATTKHQEIQRADVVVFVTGTPVDEHLNPKLSDVLRVFDSYAEHIAPGALVIMRSTLFPGTTEHLYRRAQAQNKDLKIAFCPERVAEGDALNEIRSLPQIVSAFEEEAFQAAYETFAAIAPVVIRLEPLEAELVKLMANSWRYLEFAISNQFFMIAEKSGVDFLKLYDAIRYEYPRAAGYKAPGFAAGPCLFKDTMQLASFFDHQFYMGHAAMLANEGFASVVVDRARALFEGSLWGRKIGLLGMTFKPNSDDIRDSLSFRVKKEFEFSGADVIWHDPHLEDSESLETLMRDAEVLVLCTPHAEYRDLEFAQDLIDVWGVKKRPTLEILPGTRHTDSDAVASS